MPQPRQTRPRFFYGYIVVIAAFFITVASWGPYNAFGVFFNPLLTEFGWTRAVTSGAFSLSMMMRGVLGIVMGGLTDRFGPRIVMALCGVLLGLGLLLMSQVSALWQLYLFYGVIISTGVSSAFISPLSTVARWFDKRRSLVSGIIVSGVGIGGLIAPPVITRLISAYDWRQTYAILGGVVLVVVVSAAQFLKRDPSQMGQVPYGGGEGVQPGLKTRIGSKGFSLREAVATRHFWVFFIMLFCFGYCVTTVMVHIVPHAIELGLSDVSAANILALNLGVSIIGTFVLGHAGDRIGNRQIFIIGFVMMVATLLWLVWAREAWMLYLFSLVFGFAHGGVATSESPLVARLFGLSSHGAILGVIILGFTIGGAVGPFVTGYIHDLTQSYYVGFLVCVAVAAVGLILAVVLRPAKRLETGSNLT